MNTNYYTEAHYENTLIQLFQDLGYQCECGYNVERDYRNPVALQNSATPSFQS